MAEEKNQSVCGDTVGCCCVNAVVSVDERGQMVLPKEIREKADIKAGEKLALVTWDGTEGLCCIALIKADRLAGMVRNLMGPMMQEITKTQDGGA